MARPSEGRRSPGDATPAPGTRSEVPCVVFVGSEVLNFRPGDDSFWDLAYHATLAATPAPDDASRH